MANSFKPSVDLRGSMRKQNKVAWEITNKLLTGEGKDKNMVYSPLSIHTVLSMIAAGAEGANQDQMLKFLKSKSIEELNSLASNIVPLVFADGSEKGGPRLSFANGIWIEKSCSLKPPFKNVMEVEYKAALEQVDFKNKPEEARCQVNAWGEKETNGLIKQVLPPNSINEKTRLVLANALYFKGDWDIEFDASATRKRKFHLLNDNSVKAPFMDNSFGRRRFIGVFDSFKVLKLPYRQGEDHGRHFSMYIFLPNATDGLPALVETICSHPESIDNYLPERQVRTGRFLIPKFKISCDFEVSELLRTIGFRPGGLTEMVDTPLEVSKVFHAAFIEVNEQGTEAAAVTAAPLRLMWAAAPPPPPTDFVADHPFLYLIREEVTGMVMFVGHVLNPAVEN